MKTLSFSSCMGPYISGLIEQKQLAGFQYKSDSYILKRFDYHCIEQDVKDAVITRKLIGSWSELRPTEGKSFRKRRITCVRQLALYMASQGIESYIPRNFSDNEKTVPHILSDAEIIALFESVDTYRPGGASSRMHIYNRLALEYRILFRMIYCCGLRLAEACYLKTVNMNLNTGIITVLQSKGNKDRLVYLPEDLRALCVDYSERMTNLLGILPEWFFPGLSETAPILKTSIDRKFRYFWNRIDLAEICDKRPTVHCLRHTFVVKRMNLWMAEGIKLDSMMPYLSKHLGHSGRDETFYYFHQVDSAFAIIRQKDRISGKVIPEVPYEE